MYLSLPKTFRFSPFISVTALMLAALMLIAAQWQWRRYHYKVAIIETYNSSSTTPALPSSALAALQGEGADRTGLHFKKVHLKGTFDYDREIAIVNRSNPRFGPGFWLVTPLRLDGSSGDFAEDQHVLVSRGYIPFADRNRKDWEKYRFDPVDEFDAIVQPSVPARVAIVPAPLSADQLKIESESTGRAPAGVEWHDRWTYPDVKQIAKQLPYPVIPDLFFQRLGAPPRGEFPLEATSIDVPPSTHFGYTIEWILLSIATLTVAFLLQAYPRKRKV